MKPKLYIYDCDFGEGAVMASGLEEARSKAVADTGRLHGVRNVRLPTRDELAWREAMGGWCGGAR